ncbi:MAG: hypothetical protein AB7R55_15760 [Gemmatimonadales bacterium]
MKWTVLILGLGLFTSSGPPASSQRGAATPDTTRATPASVERGAATQDATRAKPASVERDSTRAEPKIVRPAPAGEPHLERRKPPGRGRPTHPTR